MNRYIVSCRNREGLQYSATFDMNEDEAANIIRRGWEEAIRLCGHITAIKSAFISTIEGKTIGSLS